MSHEHRRAAENRSVIEYHAIAPPRRSAAAIVLLVAALAALHLAHGYRQSGGKPGMTTRFADERNYYLYCADGFARDGMRFLASEEVLRSPPLAWLVPLLCGRNLLATELVNVGLTLGAAGLIAAVAARRFGRRSGMFAFALVAGGYQVVEYSMTALSEPQTLFLVCLALFAIDRAAGESRKRFALLAGAALGAAALTRASLQFAAPLVATILWLAGRRGDLNPAFTGRKALLLVAAAAAVIAPWLAHTRYHLGSARIASGLGAVLYLGSDPRTDGDEPPFSGMQWQTGPITKPYDHMQLAGDRRLFDAAMAQIRRHPLDWLALAPHKCFRTLIGGPRWHFFPGASFAHSAAINKPKVTWVRFLWWTVGGTLVTLFGLAGLLRFARGREPVAVAGIVLTLYLVVVHSVTYALPRFGVPLAGVFAIGVIAWFRPPLPRWITALLVALTAATAIGLANWNDWYPPHIVALNTLDRFTIDREVTTSENDPTNEFPIQPLRIPFNASLFLQMSHAAPADGLVRVARVVPRFAGGEYVPSAAIDCPLSRKPGTAIYRLGLELNDAWRGRTLTGLRIEPPAGVTLRADRLTISH